MGGFYVPIIEVEHEQNEENLCLVLLTNVE